MTPTTQVHDTSLPRSHYILTAMQTRVMHILAEYTKQHGEGGAYEAWRISHAAQARFGSSAYSTYPSRLKELTDINLVEVADKFGVSDQGTPGCMRYRLTVDGIAWCRRNKMLAEEGE